MYDQPVLSFIWVDLSGWIMRLIKIQYPFLEKIPLCRERKSCGIEHTGIYRGGEWKMKRIPKGRWKEL